MRAIVCAAAAVVASSSAFAQERAVRDVPDLVELTLSPELVGRVIRISTDCIGSSGMVLLADRTAEPVRLVDAALSIEEQIALRRHCVLVGLRANKVEVIGMLQRTAKPWKFEVVASKVTRKDPPSN